MACSESRAEEEGEDEEREDVEVWSEKRYFQKKKKSFSNLHVCVFGGLCP